MSSDEDEIDNSHCMTTGIPDPNQQWDEEDEVSMEDGILSDLMSSMRSSGDVTDGFTGESVSETLPSCSSVSTSVGVQNETASFANSDSLKSTGRNGYLTRTLLNAVANVQREIKMQNKADLRSKFKATNLPRPYNQMANSSVANPRDHAFPPPNYRDNGTVSSISDRFVSTYKLRSGESETSMGPIQRPHCNYNNFPLQSRPTATKDECTVNDRFLSTDKLRNGESEMSMGLTRGPQGRHNNFPPQSRSATTKDGYYVNDRFLSTDKLRSGESAMSMEITRGPRGQYDNFPRLLSSAPKDDFAITICRDKYNLPDFQIEYEAAKFYIIKSFNEDDIYKSIKYDVWTSTPVGNKKLNEAFHNAEANLTQAGMKCPIFLFFSVNASRQFVGVAEMLGPVDYKKDMKFWKLDRFNGFFPIRWHIIKDVPNNQLRHIILENSDNRPVTFTRDTQEVGLKQGLDMLNIFKSYSAKTSLLDDYEFYEKREKLLNSERSSKHIIREREVYGHDHYHYQDNVEAREKNLEMRSRVTKQATLVNLTKNLSINLSGKQGFR